MKLTTFTEFVDQYNAILVGSRFFETYREDSDWDYIIEQPHTWWGKRKLRKTLEDLRFTNITWISGYSSKEHHPLLKSNKIKEHYTLPHPMGPFEPDESFTEITIDRTLNPWYGIIKEIYQNDRHTINALHNISIDIMIVSSLPIAYTAYKIYKENFPINTREERHNSTNWVKAIDKATEIVNNSTKQGGLSLVKQQGGELTIANTGQLSLI